jgi:hypothetical protein
MQASLNLNTIYTDLRIELGQIKRNFLQAPKQLPSELEYRWKLFQQIRKRPQLLAVDRPIVKGLKKDGAFVTSLNQFSTHWNTETSDRMLQAAHHLLPMLSNTCANELALEESKIWSINNHVVQPSAEEIVWEYPDIYLWGLDERLLAIVENYIGLPVSYLGPSFRKDIPNGKVVGTRRWHRDGEDRRMVKILVYLNDVNDNGGPFEYIPKRLTPSRRAMRKLRNPFVDEGMTQVVPRSKWHSCLGACGTIVFADTAQIWHHGKLPLTERVAIIYTYTSREPEHPEIHGQNHSQYYLDGVNKLTSALSQRQVDSIYWK